MNKQIARTISILSLFVVLSLSTVNVAAGGGTCSIPSCRPRTNALELGPNHVPPTSGPDTSDQEAPANADPNNSFSFPLRLLGWAMSLEHVF